MDYVWLNTERGSHEKETEISEDPAHIISARVLPRFEYSGQREKKDDSAAPEENIALPRAPITLMCDMRGCTAVNTTSCY